MKEKPILFSGDMVKAILEGRKTQTRRVVKNACDIIQDWDKKDTTYGPFFGDKHGDQIKTVDVCPYGKPGDNLWVRESFSYGGFSDKRDNVVVHYKSDDAVQYRNSNNTILYDRYEKWSFAVAEKAKGVDIKIPIDPLRNMPSIFMPRWASRINLKILNVRAERLQSMGDEDAKAEGIKFIERDKYNGQDFWGIKNNYNTYAPSPYASFVNLWNSINGKKQPWSSNPWVWVVEFKKT